MCIYAIFLTDISVLDLLLFQRSTRSHIFWMVTPLFQETSCSDLLFSRVLRFFQKKHFKGNTYPWFCKTFHLTCLTGSEYDPGICHSFIVYHYHPNSEQDPFVFNFLLEISFFNSMVLVFHVSNWKNKTKYHFFYVTFIIKGKSCLFGLWASCFEGFSRKRELQTNNEKTGTHFFVRS